jgi:AAA-like domain/Putative peptidoglycan binding domain
MQIKCRLAYAGVINSIVMGLGLVDRFDDAQWWQELARLSAVQRFSKFMDEVLLRLVPDPIVIFIDEIDRILSLNFNVDGFFAVIRECYNKRSDHPDYRRLIFALIGVATPSDLIRDQRSTPFNIGRAIDLRGFELAEAMPLAQGLVEKVEHPEAVLAEILAWTGGQPFLTQKLCQLVRHEPDGIDAGQEVERVRTLVQQRVIENWESQDEPEHLRTIGDRLTRDDQYKGQLLGLYQQILQQGALAADSSTEQMQLRLTGLIVERQDMLCPYNRLYATVFNTGWVEGVLAELRPYAEMIQIWLGSEEQDESRLLRGQALAEAQAWAADKRLSDQDTRFLRASEQAEKRVITEQNQILAKANRRAKNRLTIATVLLGTTLVTAIVSSLWAGHQVKTATAKENTAEHKANTAEQQRQNAESRSQDAQQKEAKANGDLVAVQAKEKATKEGLQTAQTKLETAQQELITASQKVDAAKQEVETAKQLATQQIEEAETKVSMTEKKLIRLNREVHDAQGKLDLVQIIVKDPDLQQGDLRQKINAALGVGDTGPRVLDLQKRLLDLCYLVPISGGTTQYFGVKTEEAIKKFQRDHKLDETGKADRATVEALDKAVVAEKCLPNDEVKMVQRSLINMHYYHGTDDGIWNPSLTEAIKTFQKDQGLDVDGIWGRQTQATWERLSK